MMKPIPSAFLLALLGLAACAQEPARRGGASAAQASACRQRSDEVYLAQNRAELYRADTYATSTRDSPFGGNVSTVPSSGLAQRFGREQMLDDCLRSVNGNVGDTKQPAALKP
jgi:hypothetical protein